MFKFPALVFIIYLAKFILDPVLSEVIDCQCGIHFDMRSRIIGGRVAKEGEFPWQAGFFTKTGTFFCGGSLINNHYILTAAHCFKNADPLTNEIEDTSKENITIALRMRKLDQLEMANDRVEGPVFRYSENILIHPSYDPTKYTNDIALIKLNEKILNFSNKLTPICLQLNKKSSKYLDNANVTISGWGATKEDGGANRYLLTTNVKMLSNKQCNKKLGQFNFDESIMMCAAAEGRDACQGDSGGALIIKLKQHKFQQIGIVSNGIGCADKKYPGIYTRLSTYSKWIKKNTKDASYCKD